MQTEKHNPQIAPFFWSDISQKSGTTKAFYFLSKDSSPKNDDSVMIFSLSCQIQKAILKNTGE